MLCYEPILFLTMVAVFFLFLFITKYVSLSSILTGLYTTIYSLFTKDLFWWRSSSFLRYLSFTDTERTSREFLTKPSRKSNGCQAKTADRT